MYCYLDQGKGAVIMTNSENGFDLANEIIKMISAEFEWPEFKPE